MKLSLSCSALDIIKEQVNHTKGDPEVLGTFQTVPDFTHNTVHTDMYFYSTYICICKHNSLQYRAAVCTGYYWILSVYFNHELLGG